MTMRWAPAMVLLWGLLGAGASPGQADGISESASACAVPEGWSSIAGRRTSYIIFGEVHGTREAPAFFAETACGLAKKGERLLIAIEHHAADNEALQAAWAAPHAQFASALRQKGWAGRNDGVASDAMFAMLVRLHALKTSGRRIDVVAFNGARDREQRARFKHLPGQGPHEAAQAENIRTAATAKAYNHVLVLVGNLHARKRPVVSGKISFEPMAMRLAPAGAVTSLKMEHASGTTWNCQLKAGLQLAPGKPLPRDAIDCRNRATRGTANLHRPPFVGLGALPLGNSDPAYDGFFWLGPVTGSPPAVPPETKPEAIGGATR